MIWLWGILGIPLLVVILLFLSAASDFWQIITLRIDFSRLIGDLVHVLLIVVLGVLAELFCLYELVMHFL